MWEKWSSLPAMFFGNAQKYSGQPFLWRKQQGQWAALDWQQVAHQARKLAAGLIDLSVKPGDRVMLIAESRPEWLIADMAIMSIGAITVPSFTTNTTLDHLHILRHSGAHVAIVSTQAVANKFLPAALQAPELKTLIFIDPVVIDQQLLLPFFLWQDLIHKTDHQPNRQLLDKRLEVLKRSDVCCLIYTSGTGGTPKGVMLSHGAILANCEGAAQVLSTFGLKQEKFLSFLPLSHAYEHTAGQCLPILIGAQIYYAESVERISDNLKETRPTIMTAVPRFFELMHQRILRSIAKEKPWKQRLIQKSPQLGRKSYETPSAMTITDKLKNYLCDWLVRRKTKARFGGKLKALVSGGAPLNYDVGIFFQSLGIPILQGYGQTEAAPVVSVNIPHKVKMDTVGPVLPGVTAHIADDGEILIRGECVMQGYWQDPAATTHALKDGWLHTGDIGHIDQDGYLKITDRKKDIIVLSGGDNVAPARVEGFLVLAPEITQAMVYGDRHPHIVAVIVPHPDFMAEYANQKGLPLDPAALVKNPDFNQGYRSVINQVNLHLSPIEKIRRFILAPEPFTIENGMLTPSFKIRRHKIRTIYQPLLEKLYNGIDND